MTPSARFFKTLRTLALGCLVVTGWACASPHGFGGMDGKSVVVEKANEGFVDYRRGALKNVLIFDNSAEPKELGSATNFCHILCTETLFLNEIKFPFDYFFLREGSAPEYGGLSVERHIRRSRIAAADLTLKTKSNNSGGSPPKVFHRNIESPIRWRIFRNVHFVGNQKIRTIARHESFGISAGSIGGCFGVLSLGINSSESFLGVSDSEKGDDDQRPAWVDWVRRWWPIERLLFGFFLLIAGWNDWYKGPFRNIVNNVLMFVGWCACLGPTGWHLPQ